MRGSAFSPDADTPLDMATGVRHASGNVALYERLVQRFRDENEHVAAQLRELLARGERDEALRLLHTLKGTAATLGARALAEAAAALELDLRNAGQPLRLSNLEHALHAFREASSLLPIARKPDDDHGTPSVALEEVRPLLDQLARFLPQNNLGALECFQELKKLVGQRAAVAGLEDALDRLDFQAAIPHLHALEKELAGS